MVGADFGAYPPEFNSARMYAGAGSGPMMTAAAAWDALAAKLGAAAASYTTVVSRLTGEEWRGSASAAMAAAALPYAAWMNRTAIQAEEAAAQARSAASAYETARAMTVAPATIAANRIQARTLTATNTFGQNTPAIAAADALYAEMWAQDAAAMYGYAGSSAAATTVRPFSQPQQHTGAAGLATQAAATAHAVGGSAGSHAQLTQLVTAMPQALQSLAQPLQSTAPALSGLSGMAGSLADNTLMTNLFLGVGTGAGTAVSYIPSSLIPSMIGYFAGTGENAAGGALGPLGGGLGSLLAPGGPLGELGGLGGSVSGAAAASSVGWHGPMAGGIGRAASIGALSVPQSWAAASPAMSATATPVAGWTSASGGGAPHNQLAAMPAGMGTGAGTGGGGRFGHTFAPRFGLRPTPAPVVPHTPAAG